MSEHKILTIAIEEETVKTVEWYLKVAGGRRKAFLCNFAPVSSESHQPCIGLSVSDSDDNFHGSRRSLSSRILGVHRYTMIIYQKLCGWSLSCLSPSVFNAT